MSLLPDYTQQRARFLATVTRQHGALTAYRHPLTAPDGAALYTDVAVIGDPAAPKRMLILSGTHGVEGYYGSDSQIAWLDSFDVAALPPDCALVLVHLLNPWGAAHLRRVNEDNIDLNRNFIDFSQPAPANPHYALWHDLYHGDRAHADRLLAETLQQSGWPALKRVVEAGQYQAADGLFYGGQQPAWSHRTLHAIVEQHLRQAQVILSFDLHTGAGAWGHPMLLAIAEQRYPAHDWGKSLYE